jgi:iron complex transport system substrate-binding protein
VFGNAAAASGDNPAVSRRPLLLVGAALLGLLTATACGPSTTPADPAVSTSPSAAPSSAATTVVTIATEDLADPLPAQPTLAPGAPQRIVSLAIGLGETLAALGVGDRVVGRDEASASAAIGAAPVVTKAHATSAEQVLALEPDLVLVDAGSGPPEAIDQIRSAGVRVVEVPQAWTLADIGPRTRAAAEAVGVGPDIADAVVAESTATAATPGPEAPTVAFLYLRGTSAVYLLGGAGSGADALIAAAGGRDVGADLGLAAFTPLTAEALAAADPDVLLVMTKGLESVGGVEGLAALPGVAQTTAGRDRRVIAVDDTVLLSFGPRTGALVDALADALTRVAP